MSDWYTVSCEDCGDEIPIHRDWDNPPTICKSCKAERAAKWYERSCADCGTTMKLHQDWDNPPSICKSCKAERAAKWYERSCADCGTTMKLHQDWDNPPNICKSCKEKRAAKWYERSCADCGTTMKLHRDWEKPPKYCKSCKEKRAAKWYEISCESCSAPVRVHKDWAQPPRYCEKCKAKHAPISEKCSHCESWFEIPTGTQIKCRQKGWDLPKRCADCRELFKHKPFRTVQEKDLLGNTVYVTYNSAGQLISRSREGKGLLGDREIRHESHVGKGTGSTTFGNFLGIKTKTTRAPDGSVKSQGYEGTDILGGKISVTTGRSSGKKSVTRTVRSFLGGKHRRTD